MDGSGKILATYSNLGEYKKSPSDKTYHGVPSKKQDNKYKLGEVLKGVVIKLTKSSIAVVELPGGTVSAEIHNRLEVGDELFFLVEDTAPYLLLKVYSVVIKKQNLQMPTDEIMRILDLPNLERYYDTVKIAIQYRSEIIRNEIIRMVGLYYELNDHGDYSDFDAIIETLLVLFQNDLSHNKIHILYSFFAFPRVFIREYKKYMNIYKYIEKKNKSTLLKNLIISLNSYSHPLDNIDSAELIPDNQKFHDMLVTMHTLNTSYAYGDMYYILIPYFEYDKDTMKIAKLLVLDKSQIVPEQKSTNFGNFMQELIEVYKQINGDDYRSNNNLNTAQKFALEMKNQLLRKKAILMQFVIYQDDMQDCNLLDRDNGFQQSNISVVV